MQVTFEWRTYHEQTLTTQDFTYLCNDFEKRKWEIEKGLYTEDELWVDIIDDFCWGFSDEEIPPKDIQQSMAEECKKYYKELY